MDHLPQIEKRGRTSFTEFTLSKSNSKLAKKTLEDYLYNKENSNMNVFRARSVSKKLYTNDAKTPKVELKRR